MGKNFMQVLTNVTSFSLLPQFSDWRHKPRQIKLSIQSSFICNFTTLLVTLQNYCFTFLNSQILSSTVRQKSGSVQVVGGSSCASFPKPAADGKKQIWPRANGCPRRFVTKAHECQLKRARSA